MKMAEMLPLKVDPIASNNLKNRIYVHFICLEITVIL